LKEALNLSLLLVPRSDGGPGVFVTLAGAEEIDAPISDKWRLKLEVTTSNTLDFQIGFFDSKNNTGGGSVDAKATLRIQAETDEAEKSFVIPGKKGTRLEFGKISFAGEISSEGAGIKALIEDGALVISGGDCDGFTAKALPSQETRIGFGLGIGLSSQKGL